MERLDEVDPLTRFTVYLTAECDADELRSLADVEGVAEIRIEPSASTAIGDRARGHRQTEPSRTQTVRSRACRPVVHRPIVEPGTSSSRQEPTAAATGTGSGSPPRTSRAASRPRPKPGSGPAKAKIAETIRVDSDRLDHLMNLAGELVITKARFVAIARGLEELFRGSNARALTSDTRERLESITRGLEGLAEIKSGSSGGSLDRWSVHVRRLRDNFRAIQDELDLIREAREQLKSLSEAIHSLGRVSDGLQKGVLDTRMVPIGPLFERFRRVIRDLSLSSGKEVTLQIGGEKTELDKRMIDELSDPLIHMVRNAVDHGLEPPDEREAAGKPRAGTVSLLASHRGNSVVITVSDDGRGIDCERIRKKIVAKGLVEQGRGPRALRPRADRLHLAPGPQHRRDHHRDLRARRRHGHRQEPDREPERHRRRPLASLGQGTTFTIRLPLTLAIMSSLLVRIYDEVYAIPLDHIDEIVEVRPSQIYRVQGRPAIEIRKKIVALVALGDVFRWGGKDHPSARNGARAGQRRPRGRGSLRQAHRRRRPERRDHDRPSGRPVDRHAGSRAQVAGEELSNDPRAVGSEHPGRWPRLAHP